MAKQPGIDESCKGVILSLLLDHCLLPHPSHIALIKSKLAASTVGSLRDRERSNAILETIESLVPHPINNSPMSIVKSVQEQGKHIKL